MIHHIDYTLKGNIHSQSMGLVDGSLMWERSNIKQHTE